MIDYDLTKIRAMMFDVDGVLSCATIPMDSNGVPTRTANIKDGYALQLAVKRGMKLAIITGGRVEAVGARYRGLGLQEVHLGCSIKLDVYKSLLAKWDLKPEEVLYMGDDIPDYEIMSQCGLPCCPADAAKEIKAISRYITTRRGGEGCVREVLEQVLTAQGLWEMDKIAFGW